MGAGQTFRLTAMKGQSVPTGVEYEGTPLQVRFATPVKTLLRRLAKAGAGHHWNGAFGDIAREWELLCEFCNIPFRCLTDDKES